MSRGRGHPPAGSERRSELVLSNDAFDQFVAALDGPARVVRELVDLFEGPPIPGSLAYEPEADSR